MGMVNAITGVYIKKGDGMSKKCPKCGEKLIETYGREYEVSCGWHSMDISDDYTTCCCGYIHRIHV